jgi:hypothetical protein
MKFLDPTTPLSTCQEASCEKCSVAGKVTCHFTQEQLVKFLALALPAFILGGIGTYMYAWWAFAVFIALLPLYFGLLEIRVMCSHCPHYAEPSTKTLTCWANYGSPKLWKYRPGPMSFLEKVFFLLGMFTVFFIPALFMILDASYILLAVYVMYGVFGFTMLVTFLCTKCMNFTCPFNRTKAEVREEFCKHNPVVKEAWKRSDE